MMTKIHEEPPDATAFEAILFNVRIPGIAKYLHRARAIYQEEADIAFLDENHALLLIRPGKAWRRA